MQKKGLVSLLLILAISFVWHCGYERSAPNELVGVWKTQDPKYTNRFLEIDTDTITFGTGEGTFETYTIKKIKKGHETKGMLYTVHYEDEAGNTYTFAFYYSPEMGGVLRLKNQKEIIWKKE
jgi:hypothetical protein